MWNVEILHAEYSNYFVLDPPCFSLPERMIIYLSFFSVPLYSYFSLSFFIKSLSLCFSILLFLPINYFPSIVSVSLL